MKPTILSLAILAAISSTASADVLVANYFRDTSPPNLGPSPYNFGDSIIIGFYGPPGSYHSYATQFTPTQSGTLQQLTAGLSNFAFGGKSITVKVVSDSGNNTPGTTVLETLTFDNIPDANTNLFPHSAVPYPSVTTSSLHPFLSEGTPYWLLFLPNKLDASTELFFSPLSTPGHPNAIATDGGDWVVATRTPAFSVTVTVPEPASLSLLALGAACILSRRRNLART
jgi:hypothetical protein